MIKTSSAMWPADVIDANSAKYKIIGKIIANWHNQMDNFNQKETGQIKLLNSKYFLSKLMLFKSIDTDMFSALTKAITKACGCINNCSNVGTIYGGMLLKDFLASDNNVFMAPASELYSGSRIIDIVPIIHELSGTDFVEDFLEGYTKIRAIDVTIIELVSLLMLFKFSKIRIDRMEINNFVNEYCKPFLKNSLIGIENININVLREHNINPF